SLRSVRIDADRVPLSNWVFEVEPSEHRLFSQISRNWAGVPLRSWDTMLAFIRGTTIASPREPSQILCDAMARVDAPRGKAMVGKAAIREGSLAGDALRQAWKP